MIEQRHASLADHIVHTDYHHKSVADHATDFVRYFGVGQRGDCVGEWHTARTNHDLIANVAMSE